MTGADLALTRHFVRYFLDAGFMTTEASDGVRRALLGAMSAAVAIGLFLPRLMGRKYFRVREIPDLYLLMVTGDTLMTFGFAMLVVAFAAAFAGDSMFPDETDFRVLTPLPITRGFVFSAKLRAVAWYLGLAIAVTSLALQLPFTAISGGPHADRTWVVRAVVSAGMSSVASLFAATAVMAVQGAIVLCAPRRYLRPMAVGTRTAILCGVVLLLPLAGRMPSQARGFTTESALLYLAPPAWFVGLQRVGLGVADGYDVRMALVAIAALTLTSVVVAACYVVLYRKFDVVMLRQGSTGSARGASMDSGSARTVRLKPYATIGAAHTQTGVVTRFATATLWRSPLHQVVFLGVAACGIGWALNALLAGGLLQWLQQGGVAPPRLVSAATTMPFVLLLAGCTGLRAALMLPQDPRANWIFRMREDDEHRGAQLDAVERLFMRLVVWPVLIGSLALQWAVFGASAVAAVPIAYLAGVILVELFIHTWRRIPFTCSYIPGKRNVALVFLIALVSYVFFTSIGAGLTSLARFHPSRLLIVTGILMMAVALLRRHRLRSWGQAPLMFDDDPPEFAQPLQLL
jgi:hypothetical protein